MRNAQGDFIWYELMTPDMAGAKAFYDAVTGWTVAETSGMPGMDYRMIGWGHAFVGGMMAIDADMAAHGAVPMWIAYIGVEDVDATVAAAQEKGGQVLLPPTSIPGVGRYAMLHDPQGAPFYVMRGEPDQASTVWQPDAIGHWGWNELWTPDQQAALDFYGSLFGWRQEGAMPMGPRGDYLFLMQGDKPLGACGPVDDPAKPAYWRHVFRIPSIAPALEAARAHGATDLEGPHEVPGGDFVLYGRDPQGAAFVLVGKA